MRRNWPRRGLALKRRPDGRLMSVFEECRLIIGKGGERALDLLPHNQRPTLFQSLCDLEPRLALLAAEVKSLKPNQKNVLRLWYGNASTPGIKDALLALVGYEAANPLLRTTEAYDVAYDYLFACLADNARKDVE